MSRRESREERAEKKKEQPTDDMTKAIVFLKEKKIYALNPRKFELEVELITDPSLAAGEEVKYQQIRTRLFNLVLLNEEKHELQTPRDLHKWDPREFPGYKDKDVFFLRKPAALCQRYQKSGLCYMHGPAMVQHYSLSHYGSPEKPVMIDLLSYVQNHFTTKQLENHIFSDEGGDSHLFLKSILEAGSQLKSFFSLPPYEEFVDCFEKFGPCLVSQFKVHPCFYEGTQRHFHDQPTGILLGLHAMVVVGHRKDEAGKSFFLLQNWWKLKQFVECGAEYLMAVQPQYHFVETAQTGIPKSFASSYGAFYELEAIDKAEGHVHEMDLDS